MENSFCDVLLKLFPNSSEVDDLSSTCIINCVFNIFFTYTTIMMNTVTIQAIRKASSLPKTLKMLLISLVVSDIGIGVIVQPWYSLLLVKLLKQNNPGCTTYMAFGSIWILFCNASFFGVVAISVDRFLAIHFHLRYQELVTYKRVLAAVISIWILSLFMSLLWYCVPLAIGARAKFTVIAIGLVLTTVVYTRIHLTVRRHKKQIQSLQVQQTVHRGEIAEFAVGFSYVYLVLLICYLPGFCCLIVIATNGTSISLKSFFLFSGSLVFLNSSLNPIIYCWKMRNIRHAIMDILRNMPLYKNRASQ